MNVALLVFFIIGTLAVASSILVISMRNPVHSALFLLLTFLCVAVLFVMTAEMIGVTVVGTRGCVISTSLPSRVISALRTSLTRSSGT